MITHHDKVPSPPTASLWQWPPLCRYRQLWPQLVLVDDVVCRQYWPGPSHDTVVVPIISASCPSKGSPTEEPWRPKLGTSGNRENTGTTSARSLLGERGKRCRTILPGMCYLSKNQTLPTDLSPTDECPNRSALADDSRWHPRGTLITQQ